MMLGQKGLRHTTCMSITGWCFEYGLYTGIFLVALNVIYFLIKKRSSMKETKNFLSTLCHALAEAFIHITRPIIGISLYA